METKRLDITALIHVGGDSGLHQEAGSGDEKMNQKIQIDLGDQIDKVL